MKTRKRTLPEGWYPGSSGEIRRLFASWTPVEEPERKALSCIVPHAGWFFSGKLAFETISRLFSQPDTVVVIGGHLPALDYLLVAEEDGYETPLGILKADRELKREIEKYIRLVPDYDSDNTVEVVLPLVAGLFPDAEVLWLRAPQSSTASTAGRVIKKAAEKIGKSVVVIGSTDLTHYGPAYGFMPRGRGEQALSWVKTENDRLVIEGFLTMDEESVFLRGIEGRAACSPGAAVAAMAFAVEGGVKGGCLVGYANSADIHRSDSFVGYAGVVYEQ